MANVKDFADKHTDKRLSQKYMPPRSIDAGHKKKKKHTSIDIQKIYHW